MVVPAGAILYLGFLLRQGRRNRPVSPALLKGALIGGAAVLAGLFVAALMFSRSLAFDRLVNSGTHSELRIDVLPTLIQMLKTHFPFGTGFGAFEFAYKRIEPTGLLTPNYLNQAHDDWLQIAIEGGLPAVLLVAVFIAWFAKTAFKALRDWRRAPDFNALASIAVILAFAVASAVDYPLRVPSLMLVFALACAFLCVRRPAE
jgi:O-antigen ligase